MNYAFHFPAWRVPGTVARGGDESPSAVGPLAPTGDSADPARTEPETTAR